MQALRWLPQLIRSALTRLALPVRSDESDGRLAGCRGVLRLRRPPTRSILSSPARSMLGPSASGLHCRIAPLPDLTANRSAHNGFSRPACKPTTDS